MKNSEIKKNIEAQIRKITNNALNVDNIDWDKDLTRDVGLDSVLFIKLLTELENYYSIEVDLTAIDIDRITDITYLTEYIDSKVNSI